MAENSELSALKPNIYYLKNKNLVLSLVDTRIFLDRKAKDCLECYGVTGVKIRPDSQSTQ